MWGDRTLILFLGNRKNANLHICKKTTYMSNHTKTCTKKLSKSSYNLFSFEFFIEKISHSGNISWGTA